MQVIHKPVLGDRLYLLADEAIKKNPNEDRYKVIFDVFVKYILDYKWTYQLRGRDPQALPIKYEDADLPLSVNCFTLCDLLHHTMLRHKLAIQHVIYWPFAPYNQKVVMKWNIQPTMNFFDPQVHSMYTRWGNFALFSKHVVLYRSDGMVFDPTFTSMYRYYIPFESLHPDDPEIDEARKEYQQLCLKEGL